MGGVFTKQCLDQLKDRVDLVDLISGYLPMKRYGKAHKALCPFHQEKSPSFIVQRGDSHYHCFGCSAHGDAIQFLMHYLNISFVEAVEVLAERYHVILEREERTEGGTSAKPLLKEVCRLACSYFHNCLLYTEEGRDALNYLYRRGITIDFIRRFEVGFAPADGKGLRKVMEEAKVDWQQQIEAGLLIEEGRRPFFRERIIFPIYSVTGQAIGFSARKIKEETFGGKYINTPETPLFKKSRILFGLNFSRRRIIKERKVIIVEGQIDCLKMIEAGLNLTVAALGTAFGEGHAEELKKLQVRQAYLLFDGDPAGKAAASKVGDLLQKRSIDVRVVTLPQKTDPDSFLIQFGMGKLIEELEKAIGYLAFQIDFLKQENKGDSAAGKAAVISQLKKQIEAWEDPILIHESLRQLASLAHLPHEAVGTLPAHPLRIAARGSLPFRNLDTNRVLEVDLLRWLIIIGERFLPTAQKFLSSSHFTTSACRALFQRIVDEGKTDLLSLASAVRDQSLIDEIVQKKVNCDRAKELFLETVQKLLDREWMQKREAVRMKIYNGTFKEEELAELAKEFDELKKNRPSAIFVEVSGY